MTESLTINTLLYKWSFRPAHKDNCYAIREEIEKTTAKPERSFPKWMQFHFF